MLVSSIFTRVTLVTPDSPIHSASVFDVFPAERTVRVIERIGPTILPAPRSVLIDTMCCDHCTPCHVTVGLLERLNAQRGAPDVP